MKSILIKDTTGTTREERERIVEESIGNNGGETRRFMLSMICRAIPRSVD